MDLWDRICNNLRARKITVEDVSNKHSMDLRLLYGVAYVHTWFGQWGYKFSHGSFGIMEHNYEIAIEMLSSTEIDQVPPGEYRLSAIPAKLENAPELLFSPSHIDVSVRSPLLDIKFYQAQVSIHGSVVCKERCDSSVSLTLLRLDGKSKDEKKTIGLANESNEFFFSNFLPGKYRVEVLKLLLFA
ncbi:phd finger protein male meiocyte death 1 [Nicotiana attenuata]|uniref:Phd finger protein male meiocyte death 1 n=1 Tax=Nicotiana attenuata TaxID=49451 RepID=A0A314KU55_NICAT|nr:phd finger protein male meiocyte death 1 [Nicotiana attenuata]